MKIYKVGGAVRDELLGLPVKDRDYVVVGATPDQMIKEGFKPVGKDFPVFLHPKTHEEYALARTERKSGRGYKGFTFFASPDVSLTEDLKRRDLTINAMALADDGSLIDPFNGQEDVKNRVLRHVGPAFAEDPVRVLRIARFSARFSEFSIAPETMALMRQMVDAGEVDFLVAERFWQEISRGLMEQKPSKMIEVLRECGALAVLLPELDRLFGVPQRVEFHPEIDAGIHTLMALDRAAELDYDLPTRFAVLLHDLGKGETPIELLPRHHEHEARGEPLALAICARLKVPSQCKDVVQLVARYHGVIHQAKELRASTMVSLLENLDALRRPERFRQIMQACQCDFQGRLGWKSVEYAAWPLLEKALAAINGIDAGAIARNCQDEPKKIPQRLHMARIDAVKAALSRDDEETLTK